MYIMYICYVCYVHIMYITLIKQPPDKEMSSEAVER